VVDIDLFSNFDFKIKLNAISTSGQRSKDFIDIYYLLKKYRIGEMLEFYQEKHNQHNISFILKSLICFDDLYLAERFTRFLLRAFSVSPCSPQ